MFIPIKSTDGAMTPFEYIEAAAGTYQVGQLLNVTDGKLARRPMCACRAARWPRASCWL